MPYRSIPHVRQMSDVEQAYVGAMIDGEGWFTTGQSWASRTVRLGVGNTDLEIISALLRATRAGRVHLANWRRFGKKPLWIWAVQRRGDIQAIAKQCRLYSSKCQRWADEVR